jgi:hypothetical protein
MSIDENTRNDNYTNYEFQPLQVFYNVVKLFFYKQKFISSIGLLLMMDVVITSIKLKF